MQRRVVVTGMGTISAIGQNVKDYEQSLRLGRCGIETLKSREGPVISVTMGAEIAEFSLETQLQQFAELPKDVCSQNFREKTFKVLKTLKVWASVPRLFEKIRICLTSSAN